MIAAPDALIRRSQYIRGADRLTGYQGTFQAFSHGRNLGGSPQRHHRGRPRHAGSRQAAIRSTGATHPTATAMGSWRSQGRNHPAKQNYVLALAKSSSTEVAADIDADARCVRAMRNCASSRVSNQRIVGLRQLRVRQGGSRLSQGRPQDAATGARSNRIIRRYCDANSPHDQTATKCTYRRFTVAA